MPDPDVLEEARRWLGYATGDLNAAKANLDRDDLPPRIAAFQAQQAAEKAIKALLILTGNEFARTHDLERLIQQLPRDASLRTEDVELERLSDFAVQVRYPDALPDASEEEAATAVADAERVVESVLGDFGRYAGIPPDAIKAQ